MGNGGDFVNRLVCDKVVAGPISLLTSKFVTFIDGNFECSRYYALCDIYVESTDEFIPKGTEVRASFDGLKWTVHITGVQHEL